MTTLQITNRLAGLTGVSVASARTITINVVNSTGVTDDFESRKTAKLVLSKLINGWDIKYCAWGGCLLTKSIN